MSYSRALNKKQVGGTLIKRTPSHRLQCTSRSPLKDVLAHNKDYFIHAHTAYTAPLSKRILSEGHKMLHIIRHPKNVAVSWMRHRNKQNSSVLLTQKTLAQLIENKMFGMSVVKYYSGFLKWLEQPHVLTVRFEDVFEKKDLVAHKIFTYLDHKAEHLDFSSIYGEGATYTGKWSDWQEWWSEEIDAVWQKTGGLDLEKRLGYFY